MWFERNVMYSVCIYDLSVLAVSRMGFQKKKNLDRGVGGWVELYPIFFLDYWNFFNFAKPLRPKKKKKSFRSPRVSLPNLRVNVFLIKH